MTTAQKFETKKLTDKDGYTYETVVNDKNGVRIYTLKNGLKVYLAQNFDAPKIQTYIPVRTGSNNDPADNTCYCKYSGLHDKSIFSILCHVLFQSAYRAPSLWEHRHKRKPFTFF